MTYPEALARVQQLLSAAGVVVLGHRPWALTRFGLDPDDLHATHPHPRGRTSRCVGRPRPLATDRGFDSVVQAPTGIGDAYRRADGSPGVLPVQALDHATGYGAAAAALALLERGGVAHLSLARMAHEQFTLPAPRGTPVELEVPLANVASPYGTLRQVRPLVGELRAPGKYGAGSLAWV